MQQPQLELRLATLADAEALCAIYAPYVRDTSISFEYEPPDAEEFSARMQAILAEYPYLVCQRNGEPVGYAYAHRMFARAAYAWNAELSVYVRDDCCGMRIGKRLCGAVVELLRQQGVLRVYSNITVPNEPSERMHRALGFACCYELAGAGYKHGCWHSTRLYGKALGELTVPPKAVLPFDQLPRACVEAVLSAFSTADPS